MCNDKILNGWKFVVSELWKIPTTNFDSTYYQCINKNNSQIASKVYVKWLYDWINKWNWSIVNALKDNLVNLRVIRRTIWIWNYPTITKYSPNFYLITDKNLVKDWIYNYFLVVNSSNWVRYYVPLCWLFNNNSDWLCTIDTLNKLNNIILNNLILNWVNYDYFNKNRITTNVKYSWPVYIYNKRERKYQLVNVKWL